MQRRPDLLSWQVGSETLLFDPVAGRAHWLNSTASFIWDRIDESPARIERDICTAFGIEGDQARTAIEATEVDLRSRGLLGEPPPPPFRAPTTVAGPRFEPVPPNT